MFKVVQNIMFKVVQNIMFKVVQSIMFKVVQNIMFKVVQRLFYEVIWCCAVLAVHTGGFTGCKADAVLTLFEGTVCSSLFNSCWDGMFSVSAVSVRLVTPDCDHG